MTLKTVIEDLTDYLDFRIQEGDRTIEVSPELLRALKPASFPDAQAQQQPHRASPARRTRHRPRATASPSEQPTTGRERLTPVERHRRKEAITQAIVRCNACELHKTRTRAVPGQGPLNCDIMLIGDAPSEPDDRSGIAFSGPPGDLLTKMIIAMGYERDHLFVTTLLKCKPPEGAELKRDLLSGCLSRLDQQIALVRPRILITLGASTAATLIPGTKPFEETRGKWSEYCGVPLIPTHHPAFLLQAPRAKHEAWADLKEALRKLGRTPPPTKRK